MNLFDCTDERIMIERIGIGVGLDLGQREGLDLSIDQGHVPVHAQKGKSRKVPFDLLFIITYSLA